MTEQEKAALDQQIAREAQELADAPKIPVSELSACHGGTAGRCGKCGRLSQALVPAHDYLSGQLVNERYVGAECCGGRHL